MHTRTTRVLAVSVSAVLIILLRFPVPVAAIGTQNCQEGPGQVNHWRGEALGGGAKAGTSGTVAAIALQRCTNPGFIEYDGAFYFSNIESTFGFNDMIQVGMGNARCPNSCPDGMHYYTGWGRTNSTPGCSAYNSVFPSAQSVGTYVSAQHDFKVYHQSNEWKFFVGSTQVYSIAESSICWSPIQSSWFGETWDAGDQMGGSAASHMHVTLMNYATTENGGFFWTNFNAANACNYAAGQAPAAYQCDIVDTRSVDIWTLNR